MALSEKNESARRAPAVYRGETFERLTPQVEEVRDLRVSVLILGRFVVTGRATHVEFDTELGEVITFRDGKIASVHDYLSHRQALEDAGLSE